MLRFDSCSVADDVLLHVLELVEFFVVRRDVRYCN
jgi:hypothetical protein